MEKHLRKIGALFSMFLLAIASVAATQALNYASTFRDIKATLTELQSLATESEVYITVAEDGTIKQTDNADEAAATLKGKWHGTSYGWSSFTADVPVKGCVKITYATHDFGNDIVVTNDAGTQVAKLNTTGAKWSSNPNNVVVAYYRINEATTLHFSKANYNPYFAVEAIDEADLPAEVTNYTVTFAAGEGTGTAPAAIEVEAGSKITAPKNYYLYKEGYTLTGWNDGTTTYAVGAEIAPEADMTLTAVFTENEVSLADRTDAVTISYDLSGYNDNPKYKFESGNGIIVTQATVNGKSIDVKVDVDATNGKFAHNGSGWHYVLAGTKVTVPSAKDATIAVSTYNDEGATSMTFAGNKGTVSNKVVSYTATAEAATCEIAQVENNYWNKLTITLPAVESDEPGEETAHTWDFTQWSETTVENLKAEAAKVTVSDDGTSVTDGGDAKWTDCEKTSKNTTYEASKDNCFWSVATPNADGELEANGVVIEELKGLVWNETYSKARSLAIAVNYPETSLGSYAGGAYLWLGGGGKNVPCFTINNVKVGSELTVVAESHKPSDGRGVILYQNSLDDANQMGEAFKPTTKDSYTWTVTGPEGAELVNVVFYNTSGCHIYSITAEIGEPADEPGDEPGDEPTVLLQDIAATWDFTDATVANAAAALSGSTEAGTIESNGLVLTIEPNGKTIRNNGNSIQTGDGVVFKVPVQGNKDVVTVVGYASPYFDYSIGGIDATEATTEYKAKAADVAQGYVEVVNKGQYLISISVLQVSPFQEKPLYQTDFSDWTAAKAATSASTVTKTTKYSKETLDFTLYNTAVTSVTDTKFSSYTELPHMALQAAKAADPYVMTSTLASITKVRYIHGATGGSRGWKLEAKGDGDADWVVISDAYANPTAWSEVTADVNRTNVQLRWTNLNSSQNAYMFELDIYGMVDMGNSPALGTFMANGETYVAGDIFEEQSDGTMGATIELSKSVAMISESNPLTDLVADNGEVGTVTYQGTETACTVTIPVTLGETTLNYVAKFVQKPDFTLTYYNTDGSSMGTQQVEKDATIGTFAYDYATATAAEGQKVRGWFVAADGGRKFTTDEVITANTALYAVQTPVEVQSPSERYTFNLNDQYFYAEDHEAFNPEGSGKFHDTTHGWSFSNGDKINILVGGNATITLGLCAYSGGNAITLTNGEGETVATIENDKAGTDGSMGTLKYEGEAGTLTINFSGSSYLHKLTIANQAVPDYTYDEETKTFTVKAGKVGGFLGALDEANGMGGVTIYLPNGTYDLGNDCLTTISGEDITIKGESQEGVVIQNLPKAEGISITATLLNTSQYLTLENLTLKNAYPYYDPTTGKAAANAGRAVCLQDKGNYTVCKNVTMLSYQDTYYSNNSNGYFYFGDCEIHGLVDFVCGGGDVFYENTLFYLESREVTEGKGDVTIAAPNGAKEFGYVMQNCTVDCHSKTFNWGRSWGTISNLAWLNTTLKQPSAIVSSRFTAAGMNCAADGFYEYNTMNEDGENISPSTNVIKFTHSSGNKEYETILTADEAAKYAKDKVFASAPQEFKDRVGIVEGVANAISSVNVERRVNDAIYNLRGQRIQQTQRGINIINGRKVMVK